MTQQTDNPSDVTGTATPSTGNTTPGTGADPLLAEFDSATTKPTAIPQELLPVIRFAETKMHQEVKAEIDKEVDSAIGHLTGQEEFKDVPKRLARGFLEAYAQETPEFKKAYNERKANPKGWQSALEAAGQSWQEDMKGWGGQTVRSDVEAAKASVRGTSSAPPPPQRQKSTAEMNKMSDHDFAEYKRELAARA